MFHRTVKLVKIMVPRAHALHVSTRYSCLAYNLMKRVTEKVRDIVEVRPFAPLHDFGADPGLTLVGYHFTDITSDLMAKWLDRFGSVKRGEGAALALAGFRGVGKSHFLSVLAAILSRPDLRARLTDAHVRSAAERLSRRHGTVASVRRGSGSSLVAELKQAIAELLNVDPTTLEDGLEPLLRRASDHAGDLPLALIFDTALDRNARVARDDGRLLSDIAATSTTLGIFAGLALDDDISGADGVNSSIASTYTIDYLDQEHLYKIVDTHVFAKQSRKLPLLREIYEHYRSTLPGFRWSEERFLSLYPLHPAILEIAPLIRLYIHDFALLGFASEAGIKILGRPADSLIGLDEVFDGVEARLRQISELAETFAIFDRLDSEVVSKTPVRSRLRAKLILKGLMMLSLDGQGSTTSEIAAAMMIYDGLTADSPMTAREILDSFAAALPDGIQRTPIDGAEIRYCFKPSSRVEVTAGLEAAAKEVPDETVSQMLIRHTAEKFTDFASDCDRTACDVEWRGGVRRGEIVWNAAVKAPRLEDGSSKIPDWILHVDLGQGPVDHAGAHSLMDLEWQIGSLTQEEIGAVKRSHVLHADERLRGELGDNFTAVANVHSVALEKIWQRVFLAESSIQVGSEKYPLAGDTSTAHTLEQLFSSTLAPIFESRFPAHPVFDKTLDEDAASALIEGFLSGSDTGSEEMQRMAEAYAIPLGLAVRQHDQVVPATAEMLLEADPLSSILSELVTDKAMPVPIHEIRTRLQEGPEGFTREAVHLILAAMVARRQIEFVTASGDRINHRSLHLNIIWDDIVGIARPVGEGYTSDRLLSWARVLTGRTDIESLNSAGSRRYIIDFLAQWLADWRHERLLERFDALPDDHLNTAIWRAAANLRQLFGAMAEHIDNLVEHQGSLEECLKAIAEQFSDHEAEFVKKRDGLRLLAANIDNATLRDENTAYMSICEVTDDPTIEELRRHILIAIDAWPMTVDISSVEQDWATFRQVFAEHYREGHDKLQTFLSSGEAIAPILRSNEWAVFEALSGHPWFDRRHSQRVEECLTDLRRYTCTSKVEHLSERPFCTCPFTLEAYRRLIETGDWLEVALRAGIESFRLRLLDNGQQLVDVLEEIGGADPLIKSLAEFTEQGGLPRLTSLEVGLLCAAARQIDDINFEDTANEPDDFQAAWPREARSSELYINAES